LIDVFFLLKKIQVFAGNRATASHTARRRMTWDGRLYRSSEREMELWV
jgi:hypothetical protein